MLLGLGSSGFTPMRYSSSDKGKDRDNDSWPSYLLENGHIRLIIGNGILGWGVMMWILWSALVTIHHAYWAESDSYLKCVLWAALASISGFLVSLNGFNAFSSLSLQVFFWSLIGVSVGLTIHHTGKSEGFRILWRFGRE